MIVSFADTDTRTLYESAVCHRRWKSFKKVALRKLDMIDYAADLRDLRSPPGNRLENSRGTAGGNTASALTTSGGDVLHGKMATLTMSKLRIIMTGDT
ncbi:MAG: type II toxin-antitoxin system RelE/ParE family toxin [Sphingomonadales bacterium]